MSGGVILARDTIFDARFSEDTGTNWDLQDTMQKTCDAIFHVFGPKA